MSNFLSITDFILLPIYLILVYIWANNYVKKNIEERDYYKYFSKGLFVKIGGGLGLGFIYIFYYGGGDTQYYFWGTEVIYRMMFKNFDVFLRLMAGDHSVELYSYFDGSTGYPTYFKDPNAWAVCRFSLPFYILGFKSYLATTVVLVTVMYIPAWKFFEFVITNFKVNEKYLAWAMFYVPSVALWGSGIMKDSFTYSAILMFFILFHRIFFKKENLKQNILKIIVWAFIMISIRAFLFYLTFACSLLWIGTGFVKRIKNNFIRFISFPVLLSILLLFGSLIIKNISEKMGGRYSVDNLLEQAWIIQDDLSRETYGENSFDIGDFDPSIPGILSKAPIAITAGLFRPFIWEANNILMIFSGLENFILLILTVFLVLKTGIISSIKIFINNPFLMAGLAFIIVFALMVGLTTANFGALVRYKIPLIPFWTMILTYFHHHNYSVNEEEV